MERRSQSIKQICFKETQVNSKFSCESFIKKQYKILPKLTIKVCERHPPEEENNSTKSKLLKIFKKAKFIRKFAMQGLYIQNGNLYFPALSYIAKKLSKITSLSFYDSRKCKNRYRGLMVSWPKGMKYLKSLRVSIGLEDPGLVRFDVKNLPEKIIFPTDFLKYAGKLEELEIKLPQDLLPSYKNDHWRFQEWPKSIKKLSIWNGRYHGENILSSSLVCLKDLKSFKLSLHPNNPMETMKPVCQFLSSVNCQIEDLVLLFIFDINIDNSVCDAIKLLTKLKKIKLHFSLVKHPDNLQILKSLEDHSLEDLSLDIKVRNDEEIALVTEFLSRKKKYLEKLEVRITKEGYSFQSSLPLESLLKTIDDFPNLISLSLSFSCLFKLSMKNSDFTEKDNVLNKLFSKPILLRKFKISLPEPFISGERFFTLLEALKISCPTLDKLHIGVGDNLICDEYQRNSLIESIMSLKNLRSLRLYSLSFKSKNCFFEFIKAVYSLKYIRNLKFGDFSEEIGASTFLEGVEKILLKPGLRKFKCGASWDLHQILTQDEPTNFRLISLNEVKKKNPSLITTPSLPIFEEDLCEIDNW